MGFASSVQFALQDRLPDGWSLNDERSAVAWRIRSRADCRVDYRVEVTGDLQWLIIIHGNTGAGPPSLSHELLNAKVIRIDSLNLFPLVTVIEEVIKTCQPNHWVPT